MLLDVCHDWVGSTNACLHWPHESGVAQNARDSTAVERSQGRALFVVFGAAKERKCGKMREGTESDCWVVEGEREAGERWLQKKRSGLKSRLQIRMGEKKAKRCAS